MWKLPDTPSHAPTKKARTSRDGPGQATRTTPAMTPAIPAATCSPDVLPAYAGLKASAIPRMMKTRPVMMTRACTVQSAARIASPSPIDTRPVRSGIHQRCLSWSPSSRSGERRPEAGALAHRITPCSAAALVAGLPPISPSEFHAVTQVSPDDYQAAVITFGRPRVIPRQRRRCHRWCRSAATGARGHRKLPVLDPATSHHGGFVSGRDRTVSSPGSSPGVRIAVQGPACALDASERARVAAGRTRFCGTAAYRVSCGLRGTPESCGAASWPAAMGHVTSIDARATAAGTPRAHRLQDGQRLDRLAHIPAAPQIAPIRFAAARSIRADGGRIRRCLCGAKTTSSTRHSPTWSPAIRP